MTKTTVSSVVIPRGANSMVGAGISSEACAAADQLPHSSEDRVVLAQNHRVAQRGTARVLRVCEIDVKVPEIAWTRGAAKDS